VEESDNEKTYK